MRWTLLSLLVALACGPASGSSPAPTAEPSRDRPVTPGAEVVAPASAPPVVPRHVGIGPSEGCVAVGSALRCWGSIFLSPAEPEPAPGARALDFSFDSIAHLEVAEGTACVIDGERRLRCFGQLTDALRYEAIETGEREGASAETIEALERGPYLVQYATDVVDVAIGIEGLCYVLAAGEVKCSGLAGASEVFLAPDSIDDARRIALTDEHVCVLRDGGVVGCWGVDEAGVGGAIAGPGDLVTHRDLDGRDLVAGLGFTCVLGAEGEVSCWGDGLLDSELFSDEALDEDYPRYIWPGARAVELAAGELHACARTDGGQVFCLGANDAGQLGTGGTERHPEPVEATQLEGATQLALGTNGSCAVVEGRLHCVGDGTGGAFDGRKSPPRWARVFTGARDLFLDRSGHRVCAIDEGDQVRCVGDDAEGGLVGAIRRRLPEGLPPTARGLARIAGHRCSLDAAGTFECGSRPHAPARRQNVVEVAGGSRTLCVRHRDGTVACHGNRHGSSPVVSGEGWQTLDAFAGATAIAVDDLGSALCAVFGSGRVACRGLDLGGLALLRNAEGLAMSTGALCVATTEDRVHCIRGGHEVAPVDDATDVAFYDLHPCMRTTTGEVRCERYGRATRLGDLTRVKRIEGRRWTLCALTENGEVHCHGRGTSGELGLIPEGIAVEAIELDLFAD